MISALNYVINKVYFDEINTLFGENSYIFVEKIKPVSSSKYNLVECVLYVDDPENAINSYPDGLISIVTRSFDFIGVKFPFILQHKIEMNDN